MSSPRVVAAVVGAGPAGLLFAFAARVLAERAGQAERLEVRLFDKREAYVRTHRLRMAPEPYRALVETLQHPEADALLAFLEQERFRPAVNHLEARLLKCIEAVGVKKEKLDVGAAEGQTSLDALETKLRTEHALGEDDVLTIVGADSVHSTVRAARFGPPVETHVHQRLARLRLDGEELPETLPLVDQVKLSKLLRSLLDYRRHPDGHAEIDLFLAPSEHAAVHALEANPKAPVPLTEDALPELRGAPLFARIVRHLARELGDGESRVTLWSTFRLEHQYAGSYGSVDDTLAFLVGDAAISLPFFRGMASLAQCARALAEAHVALLDGSAPADVVTRYQGHVQQIARDELEVVAARGRLIRGTREVIRVSAMLPFPMQTWLLSAPEERPAARLTDIAALNGAAAVLALALVAAGPALGLVGALVAWSLAGLVHLAGGLLYRQTANVDPTGWPAARNLWRTQMLGLMAAGVLWPALGQSAVSWVAAGLWFVLGLAFAAGIVLYEQLEKRWWPRARL